MATLISPDFWLTLLVLGVVVLAGVIVTKKTELLNSTAFAVGISVLIVVAYFSLLNHHLMDGQGLDYWYLFRD